MVQRVAAYDSTVLITGESGSGKELVASALHYNTLNPRKDQAFLAVNCGALPETLLESELFGYLKGAFTGATANKKGFFEVTHEGTLFLDEIGEVPLATQAKLLRVLDMGEFIKLGSTEPTHVDVRIVAATNKDLSEEVAQRVFRADLYHRLNVVEIHVPSLREHREDIAELVTYFLETYNRECGKTVKVDDQAVAALSAYDWPGNIRELKNFVHRLVLVSNLDVVHAGDLPAAFQMSDRATPLDGPLPFGERKRMVVEQFERQYFHQLLEQAGGNVSRAARTARMGRRYLIDRLKLYGLEPREFRRK
jgi:transcriptional regulator with PAS, ATPase and Fis domain